MIRKNRALDSERLMPPAFVRQVRSADDAADANTLPTILNYAAALCHRKRRIRGRHRVQPVSSRLLYLVTDNLLMHLTLTMSPNGANNCCRGHCPD